MSKQMKSDEWTGALYSDHTLTLWQMRGTQVVDERSVEMLHPCSSIDLEEQISQTGWPNGPIYASGLADAPLDHVPIHCQARQIQTQVLVCGSLYSAARIAQNKPFGILSSQACAISGFLSLNPNWDGVICVVDDHSSSWALVSADEIVSFDTAMTPLLAKSLGFDTATDMGALKESIGDTLSRPEALATRLSSICFSAEAGHMTHSVAASHGMGYLLGAELAATRPYWLGQNLALIATQETSTLYYAAFESQSLPVTVADKHNMIRTGLNALRRRFASL